MTTLDRISSNKITEEEIKTLPQKEKEKLIINEAAFLLQKEKIKALEKRITILELRSRGFIIRNPHGL